MREVRILHTADLHMDSAFESLSAGKASVRRSEQRLLLGRLAELAVRESADIVLLSGDLLDSDSTFFETGEELIRSLSQIPVPVFIAPGNHDYYSPRSPYARLKLPKNVYVFTSRELECVELPELGVRVFGAAFTDKRSPALLEGFTADRKDGMFNLLCIHGEVGVKDSAYNGVSMEALAASNIDYAAFGHIHKGSGLKKEGGTWYSWPGCPEGRGFDETGEKTVNLVTLSDEGCELETLCIAERRYEDITVDITGVDPLLAIHTQLPDDTASDIYRITLTGEADVSPDIGALYAQLADMFFELQLRDETRLRHDIWEYTGEDTLRGLFLLKLKKKLDEAKDDEQRREIEQAARWGLAALCGMEEVARHEDK